jgi:ubiquinone/menaquinone biosynthesis C-methylase UbiE
MREYYDARAGEYDSTSYELMQHDRGAVEDLAALETFVAGLSPGRVLDVGCGTGWLTRLLAGPVVALDSSEAMLRETRRRIPGAELVQATVPPLPFPDQSFARVFSSHVYSHLDTQELREAFVSEALRVAEELVVVEQLPPPEIATDGWHERTLGDGTSYLVYKRCLSPSALAAELGGTVVHETSAFVAVRTGPTVRRGPNGRTHVSGYDATGAVRERHPGSQ